MTPYIIRHYIKMITDVLKKYLEKYDKGFLDKLKLFDKPEEIIKNIANFKISDKGSLFSIKESGTSFTSTLPGSGFISKLKAMINGKYKLYFWVGIIIIIVLIILRRRYNNEKGKLHILGYPVDARDEYQISAKQTSLITEGNGISTTLNIWFKIDDWSYKFNEDKYIIIREGLYIYMAPQSPDLTILISTYEGNQILMVKNVPLQKWNYLALTLDGRTIDVWLNSELRMSSVLKNLPKITDSGQMVICPYGGYMGQIGYLFISEVAMTRRDIMRMWRKKPRRTGRLRQHSPDVRVITQQERNTK